MADVDICLSCTSELPEPSRHKYVNFRYEVPGTPGQNILVACVCEQCAIDANDPLKFPGMEAIINARAIRFEHPDLVFTPK